ncbi:MAG: undecaprenyl-diphosphate phosphatase [Gammaproteobacteria bacterium]|nr:undecaprenyl-diphosphate phosphatase [Gammaproteobacteria bacterium]
MTLIESIILGLLEGITEFLPISSTGHLILLQNAMGIADDEFSKTFTITIQLGAILAIVMLYAERLMKAPRLIAKIAVAFIPTAVIGLTLYKVIKGYLLGNVMIVAWALAIGGVLMIAFELLRGKEISAAHDSIEDLPYWKAAVVGVAQSMAMIPGVSRSGATIIGGMLLGMSREAIVEFSFLLAIPTMLGATAYDLFKTYDQLSWDNTGLLVSGFASAFVAAYITAPALLRFIKRHSFIPFGIYRILLALVVAAVLI